MLAFGLVLVAPSQVQAKDMQLMATLVGGGVAIGGSYLALNYVSTIGTNENPWFGGWEWTTADVAMEVTAQALVLMDWSTTLSFKKHGLAEGSPLLGPHPSRKTIAINCLSSMAIHLVGSIALPKPWRGVWQSVYIGTEAAAVGNNLMWGATFSF